MAAALSIFDIYKIGVGPSSSHTLGPWKAALDFRVHLKAKNIDHIQVHLFGSLSKTGKGHATDLAVLLGLQGFEPETINIAQIDNYIENIRLSKALSIHNRNVNFAPNHDLIFHNYARSEHPNTLIFKAFFKNDIVLEETYCSVGGGFITKANQTEEPLRVKLPFPIDKGADLLNYTRLHNLTIPEIVAQNELHFRTADQIELEFQKLLEVVFESVFRGAQTEGILPGGLKVVRRAKQLQQHLLSDKSFPNYQTWLEFIRQKTMNFSAVNSWINCFALAVNEENAAMGRLVTSPTNGAAGVIPAVLLYYYCFCEHRFSSLEDCKPAFKDFLLTSGEIGCLFKKGATISAAVGGCQAEIGVSSAMAAGGLTQVLGGTPKQVLMAAEIAMEHHLGLTCDPVKGLVQIPCIERNTMGAIKAITASNLALTGNPENSRVDFDVVVKTMWDTAQAMDTSYKETAEGGLALNFPVNLPNC